MAFMSVSPIWSAGVFTPDKVGMAIPDQEQDEVEVPVNVGAQFTSNSLTDYSFDVREAIRSWVSPIRIAPDGTVHVRWSQMGDQPHLFTHRNKRYMAAKREGKLEIYELGR